MNPIFNVENITISFGGLRALDNVSFSINEKEIYSIIGPNGAGKTTIFNCISGLYTPDSGLIKFNETVINNMKPHKIAELGIARTFQNIELFSKMTVMENLMLGRHLHIKSGLWQGAFMWGRKSKVALEEISHRCAIEEIIDLLELQSIRDNFVGDLPYGKQKLVELGRALSLEPKILLLDEPSAGMNNEEKQDLIFWLKDIQDQLKITLIMIEHDMKMVMDISSRILAINFGKPIIEGNADEVASHPEVLKAYLGEEGKIA